MSKKNISQEKIIQAFISSAFEKSAGATSLADISESLQIKKASLYNHFDNRDAMYDATIEYCGKEILNTSFLPADALKTVNNAKTTITSFFKRLLSRFFDFYGNEPLFHMYVFVHTEQYFNLPALKIVQNEAEKVRGEIKVILQAFIGAGKFEKKSDKDLNDISSIITSIILSQRDSYIAKRKETVRQNPESGAGSLFALPVDETELNKTIKLVEVYLKQA